MLAGAGWAAATAAVVDVSIAADTTYIVAGADNALMLQHNHYESGLYMRKSKFYGALCRWNGDFCNFERCTLEDRLHLGTNGRCSRSEVKQIKINIYFVFHSICTIFAPRYQTC